MQKIFQYFQQITQIPHCSKDADRLRDFLVDFAKKYGYDIEIDSAGNILASKGSPKLALQAHYDMVCVGKAPKIKTYIEDGWMMAEESTLGADNGIAIAMMMVLIEQQKACEFLFTADEEIGLIGANALAFDLKSRYMLNLDSEDEAEVYVGCAGGVDIFAKKSYRTKTTEKKFYKVEISGLPGGHSGVEIDKDIPNAIKLFATWAKGKDLEIASLEGGERINSIPVHLEAVVACSGALNEAEHIEVTPFLEDVRVIDGSDEIITLLEKIPHGVRSYNDALEIPDRSLNLAKISLQEGVCEVAVSARAMDEEGLVSVEQEVRAIFELFGYAVCSEGKYPAWKPQINDFSKLVCRKVEEEFGKCAYRAIHAGLECAVISSLYPHIKIASIGPNIRSPHSTHEKVEIASVEKTFKVVEKIVDALC
jgi:dipeptidase D